MLFSMVLALLYLGLVPYSIVRGYRFEARIVIDVLTSVARHLRYLIRKRMLVSRVRGLAILSSSGED